MKTETLLTPSPELKKHTDDLRRDAAEGAQNVRREVVDTAKTLHGDAWNIAGDLKQHATEGAQVLRNEANARLAVAKNQANDLYDSTVAFAREHPFRIFGAGVLAGFVLATLRRR